MQVTLSWDLLIILFVALVVAYSFIVGKDASVKIIVATYISVIAVQALGNVAILLTSASTASMIGLSLSPSVLAIGKLILFAAAVVFMAVKGGIHVETGGGFGTIWDIAISAALGFSTATRPYSRRSSRTSPDDRCSTERSAPRTRSAASCSRVRSCTPWSNTNTCGSRCPRSYSSSSASSATAPQSKR
jgi:hypothetical protein